ITGGTGRIGSVLVKRILADGHRVVFTSTTLEKAKGFKEELRQFRRNVDFSILQFGNEQTFDSWVEHLPFKIDTIIHNARSLNTLSVQENGLSSQESIMDEFRTAVVEPYSLTNALISN